MKILKMMIFLLATSLLLGACAVEGPQTEEPGGKVAIVDNNPA